MAIGYFEYTIKRGVVCTDDSEPNVKALIEECVGLCRLKKNKEAIDKIFSKLYFEWCWGGCDGDTTDIVNEVDDVMFDCDPSNCSLKLGLDQDRIVITATVRFENAVNDGLNVEDVQEWLDDNSAYACGYLSGGWSYSTTDGDNVIVVKII